MRWRTDIVSGIAIAVGALLLLVVVVPAYTSPPQSVGNLSPAFLPSVAAGTMLVLALVLAASTFARGADVDDAPHEEFGREARGIGARDLVDIALWCGFSVALMLGFQYAGFLATAIPGLAVMMLYAGQRSALAIGLVSVGMPVLIQLISWHAFGVELP